jgi:hypothetical protein
VIARLRLGRRSAPPALVERPWSIALAIALAAIAAAGWLTSSLGLAVAVGLELAVGGLGAVALMGPWRPGLGLARYATLAIAGVGATLAGRMIPGGVSLLFVPFLAILLWSVLWLELHGERVAIERTALDLALTGTLFAATAGINALFGPSAWPPPVALVALLGFVLGLRSAEARGGGGVEAVGQALLHGLAVGQVAVAVSLLGLPGLVGPAIVALAFYAWGGAAEALGGGASGRSVIIEFGSLGLLGLLVALLMHQP